MLLNQSSLDVDLQSYDGSTALHLAVMDELDDICSILIDHGGADPTLENFICSSSSDEYEEYDNQSDDDAEVDGPRRLTSGRVPLGLTRTNNHSVRNAFLFKIKI